MKKIRGGGGGLHYIISLMQQYMYFLSMYEEAKGSCTSTPVFLYSKKYTFAQNKEMKKREREGRGFHHDTNFIQ